MTRIARPALYVVLLAAAAASAFPLAFSVLMSLREPARTFEPGLLPRPPTLANYVEIFRVGGPDMAPHSPQRSEHAGEADALLGHRWRKFFGATWLFGRWVANSVLVSAVTVLGLALLSLMAGYAFARLRFPGRAPLFLLMLGAMMVPGQVLWIPNYATLARLGWINTYLALIPGLLGTLTAGIFLASQFLKTLPRELEEAAMLDGLGHYGTFVRVILPLTGPVVASLAITGFMASWNAFAWPVIVLNSPERFTLPVGLNFFKGVYVTNWALIMAGSVVSTVPVVAVFLAFQRYFVKGIATLGVKE